MLLKKNNKEVYYVGAYLGKDIGNRNLSNSNPAGTLKMKFIINELKELGYKVNVISVLTENKVGLYKTEVVHIDQMEDNIYMPYIIINVFGKNRGRSTVIYALRHYLINHVNKESTIISYHSLGYSHIISKLHKRINFKWIPQIEEIYCLSRSDYYNRSNLKQEETMFINGDSYLFVNDILAEKYSNGKKYAVSYGNYEIYSKKPKFGTEEINLVYTGIINSDRGIFLLLKAMDALPKEYHLNILGFGTNDNMRLLFSKIKEINNKYENERISYYGTKSGIEYSEFLIKNQIGISLMNIDNDISNNAFPSKIMTYLGHSLYVVSSKAESIKKSKIANMVYFCDNTVESIVSTILSISFDKRIDNTNNINKIRKEFIEDFIKVLD